MNEIGLFVEPFLRETLIVDYDRRTAAWHQGGFEEITAMIINIAEGRPIKVESTGVGLALFQRLEDAASQEPAAKRPKVTAVRMR